MPGPEGWWGLQGFRPEMFALNLAFVLAVTRGLYSRTQQKPDLLFSLLMFGGDAVAELCGVVDHYRGISGELDLQTWNERSWLARYVDNVARLTSALQ